MNMDKIKIDRLKEVLSVPTYSGDESRMIKYLCEVLDGKGYDYDVDSLGNIFVTKGESDSFPLFVAHTDTVHRVNENLIIKEYQDERHGGKVALTGYDSETNLQSGCGGDDKCGVYLALEMLDTFDNVKAAFFISEEIGCVGSKAAVKSNPEFFENVGYAIQYDSPEGDSLSSTLMGKYLFESSEEFTNKVGGLIKEAGINKWANHPYTDIWPLIDTFDFCCLNLAAGYYRMHSAYEYVIVDDVQNAYELGLKLVEELGENKYVRPDKTYSWYDEYKTSARNYSPSKVERSSSAVVLVEDVKPITEEEERKVRELYNKSLNDWTDEDWDFYEDYTDRKWAEEDDDEWDIEYY
jgi:acetylornithine deacetylase/succinyl-diaminopimelate desuccinylase-like protein